MFFFLLLIEGWVDLVVFVLNINAHIADNFIHFIQILVSMAWEREREMKIFELKNMPSPEPLILKWSVI